MENSKRSPEKVFIGSASSRRCLRHQEGISRDASTALGNRADSIRPLGSSLSTIHYQLPCYPRRRIDNEDLLAAIDSHGQGLAKCLSLAESTLATVRCRSPPVADSVDDKLAKAEARIMAKIS